MIGRVSCRCPEWAGVIIARIGTENCHEIAWLDWADARSKCRRQVCCHIHIAGAAVDRHHERLRIVGRSQQGYAHGLRRAVERDDEHGLVHLTAGWERQAAHWARRGKARPIGPGKHRIAMTIDGASPKKSLFDIKPG
jgi:hypothetical protein